MSEEKNSSPYIYKCPGCGANKVFSPKFQELLCPHCGNRNAFEIDRRINKKPYNSEDITKSINEQDTEMTEYSCSNCGAKTNVLNGEISSFCPFCGTSLIKKTENIKGLKPDSCVPFTIDNTDAEIFFKGWIKKKWFVPTALKKKAKANEIKGVYSPCYGFDTNTYSSYSGTLGEHYTVTVGSGKNRRTEVRTRYFNIKGDLNKDFWDVMIECSPHFDQKTLDKIRPFSLDKKAVYNNAFLSGFFADSYDKDLAQGWSDAKNRIDSDIKMAILSRYHYDVIVSLNVSSSYNNIAYDYSLLPIYVSNYTFRDKLYRFFVNGNTGKTFGKVPRSPWKILRAILIGAIIIGGALLLFDNFIGFENLGMNNGWGFLDLLK